MSPLFCFFLVVQVPAVSKTEWHPFTLSSAPSALFRTIHLKDMGSGSFTHGVAALPSSALSDLREVDVDMLVDGPYGCPPSFTEFAAVVFVAGGVGITPFLSIITDLLLRGRAAAQLLAATSSTRANATFPPVTTKDCRGGNVKDVRFVTAKHNRATPQDLVECSVGVENLSTVAAASTTSVPPGMTALARRDGDLGGSASSSAAVSIGRIGILTCLTSSVVCLSVHVCESWCFLC